MRDNNLFQELDDIVEQIFWEDYTKFSPIFLSSKSSIQEILDGFKTWKQVFDVEPFIYYWNNAIIEWYRHGVYSTTVKILNEKHGKINSFKKWEEEQRQKSIKKYEEAFQNLLSHKSLWMK